MIQAAQISRFWDFNIGNFLTWIVVAIGFIWGRAQDWSGSQQRIKQLEKWRTTHESESKARDQMMRHMEISVTKLTSLAEFAERRLEMLEKFDRGPRWDGEERRKI